jgi:hypothetical protein
MNSTQWFKDVKRKDQMLYDILIGKFHADIISATPNGSGRIIAVLGIVASAIDTCITKLFSKLHPPPYKPGEALL